MGSNCEPSLTSVRHSGVGCSDKTPPEVVPHGGNLADHSVSGAALVVTEKVSDILDHQKFGSVGQSVKEDADVVEEPAVVGGALL